MNPTIASAFRAFEDAGIAWCLLRGEDEVDAAADVDILVDRRQVGRLGEALFPLGFRQLPSHGHGPHRFFGAQEAATGRRIKLDVVGEIRFGHDFALETRAEAECLSRRRRSGELVLLDPDDGFWALLLHCLLDKHAVSEGHASSLKKLAADAGVEGPFGRLVAAALRNASAPSGWDARRLIERARTGDGEELLSAASLLERGWPLKRPTARLEHAFGRARRKAARLPAARRTGGLSVALLAPDGAGKTTLAASLAAAIDPPVRIVYMGVHQRAAGGHGGPARLPGLGLARRLIMLWARWLGAWFHTSRGGLVVFDRYTYDSSLSPRRSLTPARRVRRWIFAHACPPPDLVVVLDAPAEVLRARKPEHSISELDEQRRQYRALAERLDRAEIVDASRANEEVLRDVVSIIERVLADRAAGR